MGAVRPSKRSGTTPQCLCGSRLRRNGHGLENRAESLAQAVWGFRRNRSEAIQQFKMRRKTLLFAIVAIAFLHVQLLAWEPVPGCIMTRWAAQVDPRNPLPEYPRPQLVRKQWVNLNGLWDYAITGTN